MDELHRALDKFDRESDFLIRQLERVDAEHPDPAAIEVALSQAKRVRRDSAWLVRLLAQLRDAGSLRDERS